MKKGNSSRRDFLKKSALVTGLGALHPFPVPAGPPRMRTAPQGNRHEVWVSALSQMDMHAETPGLMVDEIFRILKDNEPDYKPDIICLPERFHLSNIERTDIPWDEKLKISSDVLARFSAYAKEKGCYVICPVYTSEQGKIYNAAVVFDRKGAKLGEYRKIFPTEGELSNGISPGPPDPPVFETDFGIIGIQICYDVMWDSSWKKLSEKGAEIVFFPSAFAAGEMVNAKAWQNMYVVVSSTRKDTSKICEMTGEVIARSGLYNKNFICAPVNLEKEFLHVWPVYKHFDAIKKKYGRKVKITIFHEEEWAIVESLSADVRVADILTEYGLRSKRQLLMDSERAIEAARNV